MVVEGLAVPPADCYYQQMILTTQRRV